MNIRPKTIVCDMAFTTPAFIEFYRTHGITLMPSGPRTPWPNRAESAARLFKRMFTMLTKEAQLEPTTAKVTVQDLVRECVCVGQEHTTDHRWENPIGVGLRETAT